VNIFNLYGQYYDLFYADKDTIGECSYLFDLLNSNHVPGKRWLELGAGAGRHGRVFKEKGITWSGLELSTDMAQRGIAEGLDIKISDIRYDECGLEKFDAVLAVFHVISYMTRTEDVVSTFSNAFRHFSEEGENHNRFQHNYHQDHGCGQQNHQRSCHRSISPLLVKSQQPRLDLPFGLPSQSSQSNFQVYGSCSN